MLANYRYAKCWRYAVGRPDNKRKKRFRITNDDAKANHTR